MESPEEMQKNDPLGTQIWKLYHKTKGQLPNSERLENLTWRMMSMNLRRKELERQGYVRWLCGRCGKDADYSCHQAHLALWRAEPAQWYRPAAEIVGTGKQAE